VISSLRFQYRVPLIRDVGASLITRKIFSKCKIRCRIYVAFQFASFKIAIRLLSDA